MDALVRHIAETTGAPPIYRRGNDPPDYAMESGGSSFAVEVTEVIGHVHFDGALVSERKLYVELQRFVDLLEKALLHEGVLKGFYHLHVEPVPQLEALRGQLVEGIRHYLTTTEHLASAAGITLWSDRVGNHWTIAKLDSGPPTLAPSYAIGGALWEGEYRAALKALVSRQVATKVSKLSHVQDQKILMLIDRFHYGSEKDWRDAFPWELADNFHSVFVLGQDPNLQVLTSTEAAWCSLANAGQSSAGEPK